MESFRYLRPDDVATAVAAVTSAGDHAYFLAGGTNLVDLMKVGVAMPRTLIDVSRLPLDRIEAGENGSLIVGAMVRNSDLARHTDIRSRYPVLSEALLAGASPQLRNMASVGGNLLQRTRCPYFNDTAFNCNKRKPGSGCPAISGYKRTLAILGTSDSCIATNPSDMNVAMAALDATVRVQSAQGERRIAFADFHRLPGNSPNVETSLKHGELIVAVEIPALAAAKRSSYLKIRDRASYEFALVSVASILDIENGTIKEARIALGGVGTKPWRAHEAEAALKGKSPSEANYREAAEAALKDAHPREGNAFKVDLAKRAIVRSLQKTEAIKV